MDEDAALERLVPAGDLSLSQRMISSSVGALATSLLVTPLDVVKTRLQIRQGSETNNPARLRKRRRFFNASNCSICHVHSLKASPAESVMGCSASCNSHVYPFVPRGFYRKDRFGNNMLASRTGARGRLECSCVRMMCNNDVFGVRKTMLCPTDTSFAAESAAKKFGSLEEPFRGTFSGIRTILRTEGIGGLYAGLRPTLVMAIPATVIYFAAYDSLTLTINRNSNLSTAQVALLSGSLGRTLAAFIIAPLELLKTKIQAAGTGNFKQIEKGRSPFSAMTRILQSEVQGNGIRGLWKGFVPTLLRDVPFSAMYWMTVELTKKRLRREYGHDLSRRETVEVAFISGAFGGMIAATATMPFDVIKTRRQVFMFDQEPKIRKTVFRDGSPSSVRGFVVDAVRRSLQNESSAIGISRNIVLEEGFRGFFAGLLPRVAKVVPSCAIMLSSYEAGKQVFVHSNKH